ncbi:hypothetical protein [Alkalibacillus almallahensis]|uniref:hypothetical protein n=1 Tax=Alkalibacillus almallahensis TaxID=1379154 RepID=UPI0014239428|nr:hypothetical protein [Alkalibacillus almallahensis]NIK11208.1 hypothetical protein [Alkalibacillus almallahensis]
MKTEKEMYETWLQRTKENIDKNNEELQKLEDEKDHFEQYRKLQYNSLSKWIEEDELDPSLEEELRYSKEFLDKSIDDNIKKIDKLKMSIRHGEFIKMKIEQELNK